MVTELTRYTQVGPVSERGKETGPVGLRYWILRWGAEPRLHGLTRNYHIDAQ